MPNGRTPALSAFAKRSGRVRARVRARAADAAVARLDVHRPAAVRAQGPRQPRLRARGRIHRRWRRSLRSRVCHRRVSPRPTCCGRKPASRGVSPSMTRRCRQPPAIRHPAEILRDGPATRRGRDEVARVARPTIGSSCSCTSTSRTRRTRRRRGSPCPIPTTARSPTRTRSSASSSLSLRAHGWYDDATIVVTADHGEGLGDHQEKEHGLFVYNETIRVPLIVKLAKQTPRRERASPSPCSTSICCRRSRSRRDLRAPARAARARSAAAPYRPRRRSRRRASTPKRCIRAITSAGASSRRSPTGATSSSRRRRPSCTTSSATRDERENIVGDSRPGRDGAAVGTRSAHRRTRRRRPVGRVGRRSRAAGRAGLRRHARAAPPAPTCGRACPTRRTRSGILVKYREAVDLISARKYDDGMARAAGSARRQSGHDRRAGFTAAGPTSAWAGCQTRIRRIARRSGESPMKPARCSARRRSCTQMNRFDEARKYAELAIAARRPRGPPDAREHRADAESAGRGAARRRTSPRPPIRRCPTPLLVQGMIEYNQKRFAEALPLLLKAREAYAKRTLQARDLQLLHRRLAGPARAVQGSRAVLPAGAAASPAEHACARRTGAALSSRWAGREMPSV